jgi:hypothetical protein
LINFSKSSGSLLGYLEKYVMHSGVLNTKLDELSFKNFRIALKKDIAADIEASKETRDSSVRVLGARVDQSNLNSHPLISLFQEQRESKISVDDIFILLNHQLKDMSTLFNGDAKSEGRGSSKLPRTQVKGEYMSGGILDIFIRK